MPEDVNPKYWVQQAHTVLLIGIVLGNLDMVQLAKEELQARGVDIHLVKSKTFIDEKGKVNERND